MDAVGTDAAARASSRRVRRRVRRHGDLRGATRTPAARGLARPQPAGHPDRDAELGGRSLSLRFGSAARASPCRRRARRAQRDRRGVELLRRGAADLVVAGGVDAMVTYNALCSFLRLDVMSRCVPAGARVGRPFDVDRDGFVMGEGAGFVVLERERTLARSGPPSGTSWATGRTPTPTIWSPEPGRRGCAALHAARARRRGHRPRESVTSTPWHRDACQRRGRGQAVIALFGAPTPPVTAVKGATGHMIGGSGAVEAIVALLSLRHGVVRPSPASVSSTPRWPSTPVTRVSPAAPPAGAERLVRFRRGECWLVLSPASIRPSVAEAGRPCDLEPDGSPQVAAVVRSAPRPRGDAELSHRARTAGTSSRMPRRNLDGDLGVQGREQGHERALPGSLLPGGDHHPADVRDPPGRLDEMPKACSVGSGPGGRTMRPAATARASSQPTT